MRSSLSFVEIEILIFFYTFFFADLPSSSSLHEIMIIDLNRQGVNYKLIIQLLNWVYSLGSSKTCWKDIFVDLPEIMLINHVSWTVEIDRIAYILCKRDRQLWWTWDWAYKFKTLSLTDLDDRWSLLACRNDCLYLTKKMT